MQDHPPSHVVCSLIRQEVAQKLGAASRNDAPPGLRVLCEGLALEGINLVADDAGDFPRRPFHRNALTLKMFRLGFHGHQTNSDGGGDVFAAAKAIESVW